MTQLRRPFISDRTFKQAVQGRQITARHAPAGIRPEGAPQVVMIQNGQVHPNGLSKRLAITADVQR